MQTPALQYCPLPLPHVVPAVTAAQVPFEPSVLLAKHEWQAMAHALLQQTPSTQVFPLGHWLEVAQVSPLLNFGLHVPDAQ